MLHIKIFLVLSLTGTICFILPTFPNGRGLYTSLGYKANSSVAQALDGDYWLYNEDLKGQSDSPALISVKEVTSLVYEFKGDSNTALGDTEEVGFIEDIMTRLLVAFGDKVLLNLLRSPDVLGPDLSIDALVFDEYEKTKLTLYDSSGGSNGVSVAVKDAVNFWFGAFEKLAYIVYLILLIYIGIMIVLHSGTGQQDKWKSYIGNWVVGLIMLTFLPRYGIPYLFKINSALVGYIGNGHKTMQTYYNLYDSQLSDIMGSDSTTISVEVLVELREGLVVEQDNEVVTIKNEIRNAFEQVAVEAKKELHSDSNKYTVDIDSTVDTYVENRFKYLFSILNGYITRGLSDAEIEGLVVKLYPYNTSYSFSTGDPNEILYRKLANTFSNVLLTEDHQNVKDEFWSSISNYCSLGRKIGVVDEAIETVKNDLMGMMRAYAGKYRRIVFALLWYVLFFQLISLVFIYFKRIFIIAILIAIFPLIMMSYAVDKMNDGKSQTFSLWFRELLANVFLQSVHATIYAVLIDMGLEIYSKDNGNWIFLMASIIMLLPAEALLKEVFNLQGSTLGRLGGMLEKMLAGGIAAVKLATAFRKRSDATVTAKNKARFDKLQNRQNRADALARARTDKRIAKNLKNGNTGGIKPTLRDKMYAAGSNVRSARAKVMPAVDTAFRTARNVAGVAVGTGIALSGGDLNSLQEGAQIAKAITGKTKNLSEDKVNIRSNLSSAYKRNKARQKKSKP